MISHPSRPQAFTRPRRLSRIARATTLLALASIASRTTPAAGAQSCRAGRTALVLAGGGARGLAHIGVIHALERAGERPDFIVGTSMGALIGALYASGYSGSMLDSTLGQLAFLSGFHTYAPRSPVSLRLLPATVLFEQTAHGFVLQNAAVRESEINATLDAVLLRGNLMARGRFDGLPIPFSAVATDLTDRKTVVLQHGDLAQAVRASIALPLLFAPVSMDGHLLADGGLSDNVPVDVARALGADHVIVSRMTSPPDSVDFHSQFAYAGHLVNLLFRQDAPTLRSDDIEIVTPLNDVSRLDFSLPTGRLVVERGERAADEVLARLCHRQPGSRTERSLASATDATVVLAGMTTSRPGDAADLKTALQLGAPSTVDIPALSARLQALRGARSIEGIWLNPSGPRDSVRFAVAVDRAPRRVVGAGFAYDSDIGGRVWTGLVDRELLGPRGEGSLVLAGGTFRQEVSVALRRVAPTGVDSYTPFVTVTAASENVRAFDSTGAAVLPFAIREAVGAAGIERAISDDWVGTVGAETRAWEEQSGRNRAGIGPRVTLAWLPQDGRGTLGLQAVATDRYRRAEVEMSRTFVVSRLAVRPLLRAGWGESLPLQLTYPLGGKDGFAGLRRDELRGDTEGLASLLLSYRLTGALLLRTELMAGQIAYHSYAVADSADAPETIVVPRPDRIVGVRSGLGVDTPVGPMRLEYGLNSRRRHSAFIRLGRWF